MVLSFLSYIFIAGGLAAILYAVLALLSMMDHARRHNALPENRATGTDMPVSSESSVAEAYWERTKIFLQNQRLDAAVSDCRRVLEINPDHADAKRLWEHLFPPKFVSTVPVGKALLLAVEAKKAALKDDKVLHDPESKQPTPACFG